MKNDTTLQKQNGEPEILHGAYDYSKMQAEKSMRLLPKSKVSQEKRILIIYTGGTIGMEKTSNGLTPRKKFLYNYCLSVFPSSLRTPCFPQYD